VTVDQLVETSTNSGLLITGEPIPIEKVRDAAEVLRGRSWDAVTASFTHSPADAWKQLGLDRGHGPARGAVLAGRRFHFARPARGGLVGWVDRPADFAVRGFYRPTEDELIELGVTEVEDRVRLGPALAVRFFNGPVAVDDDLERQLRRVGALRGQMVLTPRWLLRYRLKPQVPSGRTGHASSVQRPRGPVLGKCQVCHQPLTDPVSAQMGIGPECLRRVDVDGSAGDGSLAPRERGARPSFKRIALALMSGSA
jgi:hypothetical protein